MLQEIIKLEILKLLHINAKWTGSYITLFNSTRALIKQTLLLYKRCQNGGITEQFRVGFFAQRFSECRLEQPGIKPQTYQLVDLPPELQPPPLFYSRQLL